jgi:hypothetical protein
LKVIQYNITTDKKEIVFIGDTHAGHPNFNPELLQTVVDYTKKTRSLWIGMGDYCDSILPTDPRFDFDSLDLKLKNPQEQSDYIKQAFQPISKQCLGLLTGNHELTLKRRTTHNYAEDLAKELGTQHLTINAYIRLHFTKTNRDFDIYCHHGWTGGRTKTGAIKSVGDLANIYSHANLYVMGHVHQLGLADERASLYINSNLDIKDNLQYFAFSGSFLRGYVKDSVSYVEEKGYRPNVLGALTVTITPQEDSFKVDTRSIR